MGAHFADLCGSRDPGTLGEGFQDRGPNLQLSGDHWEICPEVGEEESRGASMCKGTEAGNSAGCSGHCCT